MIDMGTNVEKAKSLVVAIPDLELSKEDVGDSLGDTAPQPHVVAGSKFDPYAY